MDVEKNIQWHVLILTGSEFARMSGVPEHCVMLEGSMRSRSGL